MTQEMNELIRVFQSFNLLSQSEDPRSIYRSVVFTPKNDEKREFLFSNNSIYAGYPNGLYYQPGVHQQPSPFPPDFQPQEIEFFKGIHQLSNMRLNRHPNNRQTSVLVGLDVLGSRIDLDYNAAQQMDNMISDEIGSKMKDLDARLEGSIKSSIQRIYSKNEDLFEKIARTEKRLLELAHRNKKVERNYYETERLQNANIKQKQIVSTINKELERVKELKDDFEYVCSRKRAQEEDLDNFGPVENPISAKRQKCIVEVLKYLQMGINRLHDDVQETQKLSNEIQQSFNGFSTGAGTVRRGTFY